MYIRSNAFTQIIEIIEKRGEEGVPYPTPPRETLLLPCPALEDFWSHPTREKNLPCPSLFASRYLIQMHLIVSKNWERELLFSNVFEYIWKSGCDFWGLADNRKGG